MRIRRVELSGPTQKFVDSLHFRRRQVRIAGQCLSDERVGLHLIEQLLTLERQGLHRLRRIGGGQGLIGGVEPLTELFGLSAQGGELICGTFILP